MVPVTGPINDVRELSVDANGSYYIKRSRWRQTKPYDLALPYSMERVITPLAILRGSAVDFGQMANAAAASDGNMLVLKRNASEFFPREEDLARNLCYNRVRKSALAANVELGINLAERKKTVDALLVRGRQLLTILMLLRRGRILAARDVLIGYSFSGGNPKKPPPPNLRDGHKGSANALLEWQFGWAPLAESCYNLMKLYQEPIKGVWIRERGACQIADEYKYSPNQFFSSKSTTIGKVGCHTSGLITIDDTDKYLLNRLGIINPAVVAWDLLPGSFILDWFINVKQFLDAATDLYGVNTSKVSHSMLFRINRTGMLDYDIGFSSAGGWTISSSYVKTYRVAGFPPVALRFKPLRLDLFQVRTVWALVVQHLR